MFHHFIKYFIVAFAMCIPVIAHAQQSACTSLEEGEKVVVQEVLDTAYAYDCCDETLTKCLQKSSVCPLVTSLQEQVCRHAHSKKTAKEIKRILDQRALTMTDPNPVAIARDEGLYWGNPEAKSVLSIYLCGRCQYCAKYIPILLETLRSRKILDKVAVNIRMFPIKSHAHSTQSALGIEAASRLGKGKEYLLLSYKHFNDFDPKEQSAWAQELGLNVEAFDAMMKDEKTRERLVLSKKEGLKNGVESTPSLFINGKKIRSAFDLEDIIAMLQE